MTTKERIDRYINSPAKVGDFVSIRGRGLQDKNAWGHSTTVIDVNEDGSIEVENYYKGHTGKATETILKENYQKNPFFIGVDPFIEKPWNSSLRMVAFGLDSVLHSVGFERHRLSFTNAEVAELNWNPYVFDKDNNKVYYQRDFVWSLNDKQLLIESIYNGIDIGKIVVRLRSYSWVEKQLASGNKEVAFKDIVDGKQRLNAILSFVQDGFRDIHGNLYSDLSAKAKSKFMNFRSLGYGELGEEATDQDVKSVFLGVNFTGVQMSLEHIDFVRNINI